MAGVRTASAIENPAGVAELLGGENPQLLVSEACACGRRESKGHTEGALRFLKHLCFPSTTKQQMSFTTTFSKLHFKFKSTQQLKSCRSEKGKVETRGWLASAGGAGVFPNPDALCQRLQRD